MLPSAYVLFLVLLALMAPPVVLAQAPYGLQERVPNNSLLIAPVEGRVPQTVSESGLFSNVASQIPAPGLIPYGVNSVLWSDGTAKTRFIALPGQSQIEFSAAGVWKFPPNAVVVKNFYIELEKGDLDSRHIVETRFLVKRGPTDAWDGFSYRWDLEGKDAILLAEATTQSYLIADPQAEDGFREYVHFYPGPEDCALCHTGPAGYVLGLNTAQMNRSYDYGGIVDNQLRTLNHIGLFTEDIGENYEGFLRWADPTDESLPLASTLVDWEGSDLIRRWIASMDQPTAIEGLATVPEEAGLEQNFPNPFNAQTTIVYQVGETGLVELALYDGVGQKVRTLVQAEQASGSYAVRWDGRTENGSLAASGTYLYRLRIGDHSEVRKLVLVR